MVERSATVRILTEDSGGLFQNLLQLLPAPAGYGPPQVPLRTLGRGPGHLLHHKLACEAGGSEHHHVVGSAGGRVYGCHDAWRSSLLHLVTSVAGGRCVCVSG